MNCCANCGSPIPWSDAEVTEVRQGNSWCESCAAETDENGFPKDGGSERPTFQFKCSVCGYDQHEDLESDINGVCVMCKDSHKVANNIHPLPVRTNLPPKREVLSLRKKLQNGMSVTKAQWFKMNTCNWCNMEIPWAKAHLTEFVGQRVSCIECSMKLEAGVIPIPVKR